MAMLNRWSGAHLGAGGARTVQTILVYAELYQTLIER
jgi:hypothetical protein